MKKLFTLFPILVLLLIASVTAQAKIFDIPIDDGFSIDLVDSHEAVISILELNLQYADFDVGYLYIKGDDLNTIARATLHNDPLNGNDKGIVPRYRQDHYQSIYTSEEDKNLRWIAYWPLMDKRNLILKNRGVIRLEQHTCIKLY